MNLYLFDIDGTLVNLMNENILVHKRVLKLLHNIDIKDEDIMYKFGMPKKEMYSKILKEYNIKDYDVEKIINEKEKLYTELLKNTTIKILPNAHKTLEELSKNHKLGIITGNAPLCGEIVLKNTNLYKYFDIFSFDKSEYTNRSQIVKFALSLSKEKYDNIYAIGDTPMDIEAGKINNIKTIGITTGFYKRDSLKDADYVIDDLEEILDIN